MGNKIRVGNLLDVSKNKIAMPKSNGSVPKVGEKVLLKEVNYFSRGKEFYTVEIGECYITGVTACLVQCEKRTKSNRSHTTSYRVSDFKAGLIVYDTLNDVAEQKLG